MQCTSNGLFGSKRDRCCWRIQKRSIFGFFCFTGVSSILARFASAKSHHKICAGMMSVLTINEVLAYEWWLYYYSLSIIDSQSFNISIEHNKLGNANVTWLFQGTKLSFPKGNSFVTHCPHWWFYLKIMGNAVRVRFHSAHRSKTNRLAYLPNILGIGKLLIDFEIYVRGIMASIWGATLKIPSFKHYPRIMGLSVLATPFY